MYLDPGATSLFIQALFSALATFFALFGRARAWIVGVATRVAVIVRGNRGRTGA